MKKELRVKWIGRERGGGDHPLEGKRVVITLIRWERRRGGRGWW